MKPAIPLCRLDEIPDGDSARLDFPADSHGHGLCVVRQGDTVKAYLNRCPHTGAAMDWLPGRFLDADGEEIVCSLHGARFQVSDGLCVAGPCLGQHLTRVALDCEEGQLLFRGIEPD